MGDSVYTQIETAVQALIAQYRADLADGKLSVTEGFQLLGAAVQSLVKLAEGVPGAAGPDKKAAVVRAATEFYEQVIAPLDIPGIPNTLEALVVDPALGQVIPMVVSFLVDQLVSVFHNEGVFPPQAA